MGLKNDPAPFAGMSKQAITRATSTREITVIHESNVYDGEDVPADCKYPCTVPADEIERRRGCINYGAVSNVRMTRETFERYLVDGKFYYTLTAAGNGRYRFRCEDTRATLREDASGMLDLAPLAWEFFPAAEWI